MASSPLFPKLNDTESMADKRSLINANNGHNSNYSSTISDQAPNADTILFKWQNGENAENGQSHFMNIITKIKHLNLDQLPPNVKFELDQLELELLEGDITQKGFDKKKAKLLAPYASLVLTTNDDVSELNVAEKKSNEPSTNGISVKSEKIRILRKKAKEEANYGTRYHSEIRQEAVKTALAMYSNQQQSVILSSKRNTTCLDGSNSSCESNNIQNENPFPVSHITSAQFGSINLTATICSEGESSDEELNEIELNKHKAMTTLDSESSNTSKVKQHSQELLCIDEQTLFTANGQTIGHDESRSDKNLLRPAKICTDETSTVINSPTTSSSCSAASSIGDNQHTERVHTNDSLTKGNKKNNTNNNTSNSNNNFHVNQYYFHVQPADSRQNNPTYLNKNLNRANYVPYQKTDRVVAIKNHHIISANINYNNIYSNIYNNNQVKSNNNNHNSDIINNSSNNSNKSNDPNANNQTKESNEGSSIKKLQLQKQQQQQIIEQHNKQKLDQDSIIKQLNANNDKNKEDSSHPPTRVSAKIQQLLNTLKRPKRRPLNEYFEDNQEEIEMPALDPAVPKPEGGLSVAACGEPLVVPASFPQSIEAAIHKFANASSKATCISVIDQTGKPINSLTYVKLLNRSQKIAYHLLNTKYGCHAGGNTEFTLKQGDRIALVFSNNDPIGFTISFCACLMAGLVAIPIDVPLARRDAGLQSLGFLLGQVGASLVLTSELCFKALPKNSNNEMAEFKGWPRLPWIVVENLNKSPPKDWTPPTRIAADSIAYIEYSSLRDGSVTGVAVSRDQMLSHCGTLNVACQYTEGEFVVCVIDYKREFGLWHGIQSSILNGMHMIYVPYSIMKINPSIWLNLVSKFKASVALVKSRDMHWGLMAQRDQKDINLSSLRMLLVADGANPWSLSSCDTFLDVFQSKGLRAEAICPTAGSSETLTLSIRRPNRIGPQSSGRGVLSMSGLSYGVVRVDQENSLTSLTLQDVGQVLPGSLVSVVKLNSSSSLSSSINNSSLAANSTIASANSNASTTNSLNSVPTNNPNNPTMCQTDEIGEICISSKSTADRYFGLQGLSSATFKIIPHGSDNLPIGNHEYVRSGLLGFLGPGGLVFVCGSKEGLMEVSGRRHNTDDIIATVLAVEPMKFIYRGRIAVFSIKVLKDERIVIVAEQRPDASEQECFQWMSRVLQAVDSIHHVGVYCLALLTPNSLPKTALGSIHIAETRSKLLEGSLHPTNILMCPHTCVLNLPKPREYHPEREVRPSAVLAGSIVQGRRLAEAKGRDLFDDESDMAKKYQFLGDILRWRSATNPDHILYTIINSKGQEVQKMSCAQLHKKAEKVACLLLEKGQLNNGDHVALIFPPGIDLVAAFYGCLYVGITPVPIRPPHAQNMQTTLPTIKMIIEMSRIKAILSLNSFIKLFKSKEANSIIDSRQWPTLLDIEENTKKKLSTFFRPASGERLCYLDFSVSTTGMLAGIQMSHASSTALCRAIKLSCELYPSREVVLCLDPYSGLGFALWCLNSVYSGHHSILVPPVEVELNPCIWLATVSHYKVRDTFCSYSVMELCTKGLGSSIVELKSRGINLSCVRTCAIVAEERPRIHLTWSFIKLFQSVGLPARSVSTTFGCRANIAICLQGASDPDPTPVYVDQRALRNDRVTLVERGSPHSICLLESGKLLPGVKVVIANPETKGQCADSHLGEIWVQCSHNSNGYFNIYGDDIQEDHFKCRLATGDTASSYARTGYLGFVRRTESQMSNTMPHDAIYVVGSLEETLMLRGMRYHPIDIESTVLRAHKKICECACFTWTNLLVVVVELDANENEALDLIPLVTNSVLEDHYLIVGVVVVVDPGVVPINSRGEKQRMHLRDGFLSDLLDPIYVAYNM